MISPLLFLLPATVLSEFTINVIRGSELKIVSTGTDVDIISDKERGTFGINDSGLKDAVYKYYHDRPDEVFVKGPTPGDDLYKKFGWAEVKRIIAIKSIKIINNESVKTVMASKNFINDDVQPITIPVKVTLEVNNTVHHVKTNPNNVIIDHKTLYNVDVVNGEPSFSCKNSFLDGSIVRTTLGPKSSTKVTLKPGETAVAVLIASRDKIKAEFEYEVTLEGSVAAKFGSRFKIPFSWAMDINEVLGSATLRKKISWVETVDLNFYADESIVLYDLTGKQIN